MGTLRRMCATAPRRGHLPKLIWANLLISDNRTLWRHCAFKGWLPPGASDA